jgi:hypothetical protein
MKALLIRLHELGFERTAADINALTFYCLQHYPNQLPTVVTNATCDGHFSVVRAQLEMVQLAEDDPKCFDWIVKCCRSYGNESWQLPLADWPTKLYETIPESSP